ncbi:MAG: sodium ion-translocating decarboxylase subunit beta [Faecalibacterium prausnitzii]|nr:sodium ion-translocating decarboxylase subunit beta [Faecalibacterium prausnitzii]
MRRNFQHIMKDAASIAVIGAADGPTAIFVVNTLPMMLIGMTGILLVIVLLYRRRRRCFCRIHPLASCRVVWKYSLGVMPYSFLKARKKWL